MKDHDLGQSRGKLYGINEMPNKDAKVYPTLSLKTSQFPPLKGKKVGDICKLEITAHVVGMDQHNDEPARYELEIRKATPLHGPKGKGDY